MSVKFIALILIILIQIMACYAQSDSVLIQTEQILDDLSGQPDTEIDNSDLYELIEYYLENPVNLNTASLEELSSLPSVELSVARLILEHRDRYGIFFSKYELYSIQEIPTDLVQEILPFICVDEVKVGENMPLKEKSPHFSLKMRSRVFYDLQERKGFKDKMFKGSPYKIYNRLKMNYSDNISSGIITEKDPGEKSYYDLNSGYLDISECCFFKNILIGDYFIEFGQGLVLSSSYGLTKGSDVTHSAKKRSRTIVPHTGSSEYNFFRGLAADYNWEHLNLTGFYSQNYLDANIDSLQGAITSTPIDGLHRTDLELSKRKTVSETSFGIEGNYNYPGIFSLGFLFNSSIFDHSFYPSKIYDIKGDKFNYYSIYFNLFLLDFNIFGEYAYNTKSIASISGIKYSSSPNFEYVFLLRNYPNNYTSLHGYGFGERTGACTNEFGIYNGFKWKTGVGILEFYFDQFKFPYSTYDNPLPSEGNEFMIEYYVRPLKKMETKARIKVENMEVSKPITIENQLIIRLKESYRIEFVYNLSTVLKLKTRLDYSRYSIKKNSVSEEGYLLFEDLRYQHRDNFVIQGRALFFRTKSFNSAIYEYENDLTGTLSSIGLYGEGIRFYLVFRYNILKIISISFKYSETYKPGETALGSGYQEINGNLDNKIGVQLDFNF